MDALKREVREETGLEVESSWVAEVFERITPDNDGQIEYHYVLIDYLCVVVGGQLKAGDDADDARWFLRRDLPAVKLTPGSLAVIEKAFDLYASLER